MTTPERASWVFDPAAADAPVGDPPVFRRGDERPAEGYVYDADGRIALAVNVARITGRPLLVRGKPGTGKSSLAVDIAQRLGWRYYAQTVTSRTRARDLLWSFDAVRRLSDASDSGIKDPLEYVTPGVLWWALSPQTAARRGLSDAQLKARGIDALADPSPQSGERAVLLLDEIDKADPDLPNDLLMPLGSLKFVMTDVEDPPTVEADVPPLVVITTNEERDLPQAFVRRCVVLALPEVTRDRMLEVAKAHFGEAVTADRLAEVHAAYERIRAGRKTDSHEPSLAEFLDAVGAVVALDAQPDGDAQWASIMEFTLAKPAGE